MGQSTSSPVNNNSTHATRNDNASTRTLHSTSINSIRPTSFFRRISNRLSVHPTRNRFGRSARQQTRNNTLINSGSSVSSSVRRATHEATQAAAAVTGPPFLHQHNSHPRNYATSYHSRNSLNQNNQQQQQTDQQRYQQFLSDLLNTTVTMENSTTTTNPIQRFLQIPLRTNTTSTQQQQQQQQQSLQEDNVSISTTQTTPTSRRMHVLVIEYRPNHSNEMPPSLPSPSSQIPGRYRFLGLRRPRSQLSTTSSTDTIQSMPLSMNSNRTQQTIPAENGGQWIVYLLNNTTQQQQLLLGEDNANPSYEDLLWLSNVLGTVRPVTTTQQAVDDTIPVMDWSKDKIDQSNCLVCLDDFLTKQPVRVLKCQHVFHRECVDRWLCESHNSCPICRGVPVETTPNNSNTTTANTPTTSIA